VRFEWSSAVQTACAYCQAIIVRHDVDLEKVGKVADLPADASPIQIHTEGVYENQPFIVIGRIAYSWEQGRWNEWHILFHQQDRTGWLSDAQAEYAVSFAVQPPAELPRPEEMHRGRPFLFDNVRYEVMTLTKAHYEGFEGELPFRTTEREDILFADLRTADGRFGTIDYSEAPPLLYLGRFADFDELRLRNLREFEGW